MQIKYTPEDGQIQLTVEEKPSVYNGYGQFEITVTDNGIGMKPEFLEKVFEPFERSDDKAIQQYPRDWSRHGYQPPYRPDNERRHSCGK